LKGLIRVALADQRRISVVAVFAVIVVMQSIVLARGMCPEETAAVAPHFKLVELRSRIPRESLVIGRYSVLPFYRELEQELDDFGSKLINSFRQHSYIADLGNWVDDLGDLTPRTWRRLQDIPDNAGPFVVKGATNSKKFQWKTHMFAQSKRDAVEVACRLMDDGLICDQHIYAREYVPLVKLMDGLQGMPVAEEYRFFVCDKQVLCGGFYWSNYEDDIPGGCPDPSSVPASFLQEVITRIGDSARFYVVDVARTQSGKWIVIELNDGQMSGLSRTDPKVLYSKLKEVVQ
jgi:hypothetical protein